MQELQPKLQQMQEKLGASWEVDSTQKVRFSTLSVWKDVCV